MNIETKKLELPKSQDFRMFLQAELARRCSLNPRYSLRSFAKFLEVSPSFLSHLLHGQRKVTLNTIANFSKKIGLGPSQVENYKSYHFGEKKSDQVDKEINLNQLTIDQFQIISDWYHYAILELLLIDTFESSPKWIAKVLNITVSEVNVAMERLVRLGFVEVTADGKWVSSSGNNTTIGNNFTAVAFRNLQKQILTQAIDAMENTPMDERDQSSLTLALDAELMPELKATIKQFRKKILDFQEKSTSKNRVYHMSISLYPITEILNKGSKK